MMDGEIEVESEIGVGSLFWFELPLHEQLTLFEPRRTGADRLQRHGGQARLDRRIEREAAGDSSRAAEAWGAVVMCATDADSERISDQHTEAGTPFDVVLLDAELARAHNHPAKRVRSGHRVLMDTA